MLLSQSFSRQLFLIYITDSLSLFLFLYLSTVLHVVSDFFPPSELIIFLIKIQNFKQVSPGSSLCMSHRATSNWSRWFLKLMPPQPPTPGRVEGLRAAGCERQHKFNWSRLSCAFSFSSSDCRFASFFFDFLYFYLCNFFTSLLVARLGDGRYMEHKDCKGKCYI